LLLFRLLSRFLRADDLCALLHPQACAEASQAALAARDAAAARDADVARLTAELAATRADLAAARARGAELAAAVRAAPRCEAQLRFSLLCALCADDPRVVFLPQLEREKAVAAAASGELEARLAARAPPSLRCLGCVTLALTRGVPSALHRTRMRRSRGWRGCRWSTWT